MSGHNAEFQRLGSTLYATVIRISNAYPEQKKIMYILILIHYNVINYGFSSKLEKDIFVIYFHVNAKDSLHKGIETNHLI